MQANPNNEIRIHILIKVIELKPEYSRPPYAVSKIAGITMCDSYRRQYGSDFISAMPTNLYGPPYSQSQAEVT